MELQITESKAPKDIVGETPEDIWLENELLETPAFVYILHNGEKDRYEIKGVAVVNFYSNGAAEVLNVEPEGFEEEFLEKNVYDVEDHYLTLVSDESQFNQMLAAHWNQLPLMYKSPYSLFVKVDSEGLDKMIEEFGWRLDELEQEGEEPDEDEPEEKPDED